MYLISATCQCHFVHLRCNVDCCEDLPASREEGPTVEG